MTKASLRELRALLVLADERHFGRAAERIGITQPQLSELIARLESITGISIFVRRPKVAPTPAGLVVIDAARTLLGDFQAGLEKARRVQSGREGLVRVAFVGTAMLTDLPLAFDRFRREFPDVQFSFSETNSRGAMEMLERDSVDVAFARQEWPLSGLSSTVVFEEPFVAVTPKGKLDIADLLQQPFILFPPHAAPAFHNEIIHACIELGGVPRVEHLAEGWPSALALVRTGFGVSVAPDCVRRYAWPGLSFYDLPACKARARIWMLWKKPQSAPAEAFVSSIAETANAVANLPS